MGLGPQVGGRPPSAPARARLRAPALDSGSSSPRCRPAALSPSRRPPHRLQEAGEGDWGHSPSQATSPHPGPPIQPLPASHSACVALGLELLATNRQMEKRRQPRSQALIRTALLCAFAFRDSVGSSSNSSWKRRCGVQARGGAGGGQRWKPSWEEVEDLIPPRPSKEFGMKLGRRPSILAGALSSDEERGRGGLRKNKQRRLLGLGNGWKTGEDRGKWSPPRIQGGGFLRPEEGGGAQRRFCHPSGLGKLGSDSGGMRIGVGAGSSEGGRRRMWKLLG